MEIDLFADEGLEGMPVGAEGNTQQLDFALDLRTADYVAHLTVREQRVYGIVLKQHEVTPVMRSIVVD